MNADRVAESMPSTLVLSNACNLSKVEFGDEGPGYIGDSCQPKGLISAISTFSTGVTGNRTILSREAVPVIPRFHSISIKTR